MKDVEKLDVVMVAATNVEAWWSSQFKTDHVTATVTVTDVMSD